MDLRKIESFSGFTEDQENADPGLHQGLMIVATGTNNSGQTGGLADIARIIVTRDGRQLINRDCKKFGDINDIRGGTYLLDSNTGGSFEAVVFIPFFETGHPNVLNITDERELNIRVIPADDGTVFSDLTIDVQSVLAAGMQERYEYRILGEDLSYASGVSSKPARLNTANVTALFIEDVDDTIDDLQFESNDRIVISNNSFLALQGLTVFANRIEDATFEVVEIENHTPGAPGTTKNQENILRFSTSGAGDIDVTVCSMNWDI